jgi:hypothetical protein
MTDLLLSSTTLGSPPGNESWSALRSNWTASILLFILILSFMTLAGCSEERADPGCPQAALALHEAAQIIETWDREERELDGNSVGQLPQGLSYIEISIADLMKCALSTENEEYIDMMVDLQLSSNLLSVFLEKMESSGNAGYLSSEVVLIAERAATYAEKLDLSYQDDKVN